MTTSASSHDVIAQNETQWLEAAQKACSEAERVMGATAPNPPVGAAVLDEAGRILAASAHERAGTEHAEARAIRICREAGVLPLARAIFVTLEPCNHHGRTPPCTEAILGTPIREVIYGVRDPNPRVLGDGADRLRRTGVEASSLEEALRAQRLRDPRWREVLDRCRRIIGPFARVHTGGLPWVTVKTAHQRRPRDLSLEELRATMIPPSGQKTFTSKGSLRLAHELRRRADAILTGSGTVLADQPLFTVREVEDHAGKRRVLALLDRSRRVDPESPWMHGLASRGFELLLADDLEESLRELARRGCLEVLVEAGPSLSHSLLESPLWSEHVQISVTAPGRTDEIKIRLRE